MSAPEHLRLVRDDCAQAMPPAALAQLEPLRGGHLVVTGGTGFMGTWLAEMAAHLNDDHGFGLRLTLTCTQARQFAQHASHLARRPDVEVVEQDVRNLVELPPTTGWIVHAAGTPDNRFHSSDPLRTLHVFTQGTDAVLKAATRLPSLRRVLNVSSGLVYGPQPAELERIPEGFRGAADFGSVASAYAEAKRGGETLCAAYRAQHRLPTLNVRPFAFVGPYQHVDRPWAINNFLQDALRGGPIRILGNPGTVRSYMYPSDMAAALLGLLVAGKTGGDYNLGSPEGIALGDLAARIAEHSPTRVEVTVPQAPQRPGHLSRFVPDVTLAAQVLGARPMVDLESALRRTIQWMLASQQRVPRAVPA